MANQAVSTTLPEGYSSGFVHWFTVWYFLQPRIFTWVPKHSRKVEVQHLVAYHYSPVGGHMGQLRRITTLQATVRLLGYQQAKLLLGIWSFGECGGHVTTSSFSYHFCLTSVRLFNRTFERTFPVTVMIHYSTA